MSLAHLTDALGGVTRYERSPSRHRKPRAEHAERPVSMELGELRVEVERREQVCDPAHAVPRPGRDELGHGMIGALYEDLRDVVLEDAPGRQPVLSREVADPSFADRVLALTHGKIGRAHV